MTVAYRKTVIETLRALLEPRRAGPLLLMGTALVATETFYSRSLRGGAIATLLALSTATIAPSAWRLWLDASKGRVDLTWGAVAYVALGISVIFLLGVVPARLLQMRMLFLLRPTSLMINLTLFIVAGWGVGRDIALEARVKQESARADALALEAERAQLLAIRANLDPHFLFNTLNAIAEWCHEDPLVAEAALVQLSAMLRTIFDGVRAPSWPLERELSLVKALFEMHRLRDPAKVTVSWTVPVPLPDLQLPPLTLLPLAENAMKHGPSAGHSGVVRLRVQQTSTGAVVEMINPGRFSGPRPGGNGLEMVRKRLNLAYGALANLDIEPVDDATRVRLTLPSRPVQEGLL